MPWEFLSSRQPGPLVSITFQALHDSYPNTLCLNETEMHIWYLQFGTKVWTASQSRLIRYCELFRVKKDFCILVLDLIYCEVVTTQSVTGEIVEPTGFLNSLMCLWLTHKSRGGHFLHWAFMHCLQNLFGKSCGHGHYTALGAVHGDWCAGRHPSAYTIPEDSPSCFLCMCFSTT